MKSGRYWLAEREREREREREDREDRKLRWHDDCLFFEDDVVRTMGFRLLQAEVDQHQHSVMLPLREQNAIKSSSHTLKWQSEALVTYLNLTSAKSWCMVSMVVVIQGRSWSPDSTR
jgi:hypothetical protein